MVSINIDTKQFVEGFNQLPRKLVRACVRELKQQVQEVRLQARRNHRFTSHTSYAENSISTNVLDTDTALSIGSLVGEVGLDDSVAFYSVFLHEGHGAPHKSVEKGYPFVWQPDKFLDKALEYREPFIRVAFEQAIAKELAE